MEKLCSKGTYFFTSESVTEGHPDKICDKISDAVLDAIFQDDPDARVACECLTKTGIVVVAGEITTKTYVDMQKVVRETIREIGYNDPNYGFDADGCGVLISISEQSPDIAQGVDEKEAEGKDHEEQGAGDQGMMFGYASNETPEYMPLTASLAHRLAQRLTEVRKKGILDYLRPDGKTQVTVKYVDGKPQEISTIVVAAQHSEDVKTAKLREDIKKYVIDPVCEGWMTSDTRILINGTGRFIIGGPVGDAGLTGRKIIVDTYGGVGAHGGGCFSGKDPSKVDRSGAYAARYIAKNVVAAGLADKCEIQLAYCIGVAEPVSILVDTKGTGKIKEESIEKAIRDIFPLKPAQIIKELDLRRPIYKKTAAYGHFGREDPDFTWEKTDKAEQLKKYLG